MNPKPTKSTNELGLLKFIKYSTNKHDIYERKHIFIASEAKWASASARSKLFLTNGYLEKSCISATKHFGHMVMGTKSVCFDPIIRYMEWTGPTRPDRHAFERLITQKLSIIQKKVIRHKMFVNFIKLMYQIFRKILRIVFELWSFYWRWNFDVFCS